MQFVLPVTWTYGKRYGITLEQLASWWSERPAKLAGLDLKVNSSFGWFYFLDSLEFESEIFTHASNLHVSSNVSRWLFIFFSD